MVAALPAIEPQTSVGTGLTLPIAKGMSHLNVVAMAHKREDWPLTGKDAANEISAAIDHFNGFLTPETLLSPEGYSALQTWSATINNELSEVARIARITGDEPFTDDLFNIVITMITTTWQILTVIDREITGIAFADPGSQP